MFIIVVYDVNTESNGGKTRLRKVAKACEGRGIRVQNSVFECDVDPGDWVFLKSRLLDLVDLDRDSLRFYLLGANWDRKIEHHGKQPLLNHQEELIL